MGGIISTTSPHQYYKDILDSFTNAVCICSESMNITYVNKEMVKLFGYKTKRELIGKHITHLMPEHIRDEHNKAVDHYKTRLSKSSPCIMSVNNGKFVCLRKDKSTFITSIHVTLQKKYDTIQSFTAIFSQVGNQDRDQTYRNVTVSKAHDLRNEFQRINVRRLRRLVKAEVRRVPRRSCSNIEEYFSKKVQKEFNHPLYGQIIGSGSFGVVYLIKRNKQDTDLCALKVIDKRRLYSKKVVEATKREIQMLINVNHRYINSVKYVEESLMYIGIYLAYESGGDLFSLLYDELHGEMDLPSAKLYIYQILQAIKYLHSIKIIHRDLKPENVTFVYRWECENLRLWHFNVDLHRRSEKLHFWDT